MYGRLAAAGMIGNEVVVPNPKFYLIVSKRFEHSPRFVAASFERKLELRQNHLGSISPTSVKRKYFNINFTCGIKVKRKLIMTEAH